MFKKNDYIIISLICFFLGIFLVSQYYSGKEVKRIIQPENNEVLAIEVSKLTRTNADLRREAEDLTANLNSYRNSSLSSKKAYDQYLSDMEKFKTINGEKATSGQGIVIKIEGNLVTPQIVDLINAIKNMGAEIIEINGKRIVINTELGQFANQNPYEIKVLGNSALLKSAIERKGGIVEQISTKDIVFNVLGSDNIEIGSVNPLVLKYARVVDTN